MQYIIDDIHENQSLSIVLFRAVSREVRSCSPSLEKLSIFSPPHRVPEYGTGCFVTLDLGSIFEKLLHQKNFNFVTDKN
jgi:hypothetical protein